ncbi:MAG: hypothetical protein AAGA83_24105, partial [Cyanobacteria bacterium P01_F01_bin.116]
MAAALNPLKPKFQTFQPQAIEDIKRLLQSDNAAFFFEENVHARWQGQFSGVLVLVSPFILSSVLFTYVRLRSRTVTLDKDNHSYTRQIHTLLGTRVKQYALDDIQSITVKEVIRKTRNSFNPS